MNIRQLFGEVPRDQLIDEGDRITVRFIPKPGAKPKTQTGILLNANKVTIKINSTVPPTIIKVENILKLSKVNL